MVCPIHRIIFILFFCFLYFGFWFNLSQRLIFAPLFLKVDLVRRLNYLELNGRIDDLRKHCANILSIRSTVKNKAIDRRLKLLDLLLLLEHKLLKNAVVLDDLVEIQRCLGNRSPVPQQDPINVGVRNIRVNMGKFSLHKYRFDNSTRKIRVKHTLHMNKRRLEVHIGKLIEIDAPDNADALQTKLEANLLLRAGNVNAGNIETVVGIHF